MRRILAIITTVALGVVACSASQRSKEHKIVHDAGACLKAEISAAAANLIPGLEAVAMAFLDKGAREHLLDTVVAGGGDVAVCAIKAAVADLKHKAEPEPGAPHVEGQEVEGVRNLEGYLAARGWSLP